MAYINGQEILFSANIHGGNKQPCAVYNTEFVLGNKSWGNSATNATYHLKVCKYSRNGKNLDANFDFRIGVAQGSGVAKHFRYPVNVAYPYDTERMRIMFVQPRIIFEDEANKGIVTYFRMYEKAVANDSTKRELWLEIKTASGYQVTEVFLNALVMGGEFTSIEIEQKEYAPYTAQSGYDSLTIYSMDWANKTAVLNLDSRATAEGATVGGTDNRVEAKNGASFGEGGNVYSTAVRSLQIGTGNKLGYNKTSDKYTGGNDGLQVGYKNHDCGARNLQGGENNDNTSTNGIQSGAGNKLYAKNSTINGSSSTIEGKGYSLFQGYSGYISGEASGGIGEYIRIIHNQAFAFGRYLATGRNYQARFGVGAERDADGNGKDKTSMLVVSNGAEGGGTGVDIFAVSNAYGGDATNGYYAKATKPNDALTLGYFNNNLKQEIVNAVIAALPNAEGASF